MPNYHFKVMWQFPKQTTMRADYEAETLGTLLKMLRRSENVSVTTVDKLFVHQHMPDGTVKEVLAHDSSLDVTLQEPVVKDDKKIRAVVAHIYPQRYVTCAGLYTAKEVR